ncbi:MAG: hypothetical protein ACRCWS_01645 [Propionibacteriaceae bacterium]
MSAQGRFSDCVLINITDPAAREEFRRTSAERMKQIEESAAAYREEKRQQGVS